MYEDETAALYTAWANLLKEPTRAVVGAAKTMTESFTALDEAGRAKHKDTYFGVLAELYARVPERTRVATPSWARIEKALAWFQAAAGNYKPEVFAGFLPVQAAFWQELAP